MSILSDYENIRREIGEEKYREIERFLKYHPDYFLSDVYYRKSVHDEMEWWCDHYPVNVYIPIPEKLDDNFMEAICHEIAKYGLYMAPIIQNYHWLGKAAPERASVSNFFSDVIKEAERYYIPVSVTKNNNEVCIQTRMYA